MSAGAGTGSGPNWLGLLKWSLSYSDGTKPTEFNPMKEEDKIFLENVMKSIKDEPTRMGEIMQSLVDILDGLKQNAEVDVNDDEVESLLEELQDIVEQIDMAQIFVKFGGLTCLQGLITEPAISNKIKGLSAVVIGTIAQNNIIVQDIIYQRGETLSLLANAAKIEPCVLGPKILFAISCVIRNHAALEVLFCQEFANDIFTLLVSSFNESRMVGFTRKSLFLACAMLTSDGSTAAREKALISLLVPGVFCGLFSDDIQIRDCTIRLILAIARTPFGHEFLLQEGPPSADDGRSSRRLGVLRSDFTEALASRCVLRDSMKYQDDATIFEEEETHLVEILKLLSEEQTGTSAISDDIGEVIHRTDPSPTPVLLLQPPSLSGAHQAP